MTKARFREGSVLELPDGVTAMEALAAYDGALLKKTAAVRINGEIRDLRTPVSGEVTIEPVALDTPEGLEVYRHTTAHVMAQAVKSLFSDAKVTIGPAIEEGFYYDFDVERPFTPEDLKKIEKRMKEIIKADHAIERENISKEEAIKLFERMGETYKVELIKEIPDDTVTIYKQDGFIDLCRGPHLPRTGMIKAFKLISTAGAYWRGDEKNRMLQRIYGTSFPTKEALKKYLERLEEAKKRDHRRLGKELGLFSISEDVGPGLVLWHPDGATIRGIIEDFWKEEHRKHGYRYIYTPHIAKTILWKRSGHWDFYRENLFSPMDVEGQEYIVKPMNCPFHIDIYKSRIRSYRDLPIRYAELGTVYRFERSGVLHGLLRVRGFTQDDAHIFTRPDQLEAEIKGVLNFTLYILKSFGFNEFDIFLSTRPEKFAGTPENWDHAEGALKKALEASGLPFSIDPGEGVFYGPKIDIKIRDVLGRAWQCSTIQVDFNLPERFDVSYRNSEGLEARPIMIHRALMGSLERFFGCLIEHYAGAFPLWLAPVQIILLTVTDRNNDYAGEVFESLVKEGFRAELDLRNEKLGFKIREAQKRKIPYQLVIGDKEEAERLVSPRRRGGETLEAMNLSEFIDLVKRENRPMGGESL